MVKMPKKGRGGNLSRSTQADKQPILSNAQIKNDRRNCNIDSHISVSVFPCDLTSLESNLDQYDANVQNVRKGETITDQNYREAMGTRKDDHKEIKCDAWPEHLTTPVT